MNIYECMYYIYIYIYISQVPEQTSKSIGDRNAF